jgi:hypothetical protein
MTVLLKNNAFGYLSSAVTDTATSIILTTGTGANFPNVGSGEYFYATISTTGGAYEVVKCTARSGDVLTVVRGQEGTNPASFPAGSLVDARVTAQSVIDAINDRVVPASGISFTPYANISATNVQAAIQEEVDDLAAGSGSSLVGFVASGTSPTSRTVQAKLREYVSVRDFGAVGDGVANDTTAITNAIATGKSVFFPAGTYRTGLQTVATVGQTIFGEGQNSVILANTPTTNLFNVTASYVTFQDLRMNGAATSAANTTFAIFTATATPVGFLTVQRVLFSGSSASTGFNNAIKFDNNCNGGTVVDCMFERLLGTASGFGYGVLCAGNQSTIAFNWFDGSSNRGRHAVYITAGASDCVVTGNYVTGFRFEAITQFATVTPCFRNIFSNNIVTASATIGSFPIGAMGIYGKSANAIIANNIVAGSGSCGIVLDGTGSGGDLQNTIISGNHISASALIGLEVMGATAGEIIGNKIYESSTSVAGTYSNIRLVSDGTTGTSGFLVSGNHSAGPTYSRSAFQLNSTAPTPANLTVTGNRFEACNLTTIELSGVVTPIDGRIIYREDSIAYGPISDGASANATYTVNGVDQGDICTVSHTNAIAGVSFFAAATATDTVVVTVSNLSGGSASISSGSLRIDAWKRPPGFL